MKCIDVIVNVINVIEKCTTMCMKKEYFLIKKCWKNDKKIYLHFETKIPIEWSEIWFQDIINKNFYICDIDVEDHELYKSVTKALKKETYIIIHVNKFLWAITSIEYSGKTYHCTKFCLDTIFHIMNIVIFWFLIFATLFVYHQSLF